MLVLFSIILFKFKKSIPFCKGKNFHSPYKLGHFLKKIKLSQAPDTHRQENDIIFSQNAYRKIFWETKKLKEEMSPELRAIFAESYREAVLSQKADTFILLLTIAMQATIIAQTYLHKMCYARLFYAKYCIFTLIDTVRQCQDHCYIQKKAIINYCKNTSATKYQKRIFL